MPIATESVDVTSYIKKGGKLWEQNQKTTGSQVKLTMQNGIEHGDAQTELEAVHTKIDDGDAALDSRVATLEGRFDESGKVKSAHLPLTDAVDSDTGTLAASDRAVKAVHDKLVHVESHALLTLTEDLYIYVNSTIGDDSLDEGRGLSPDKPFKSIQASINHVCRRYYFSIYNVFIKVSAGDYGFSQSGEPSGGISLPPYSTGGGVLYIDGDIPVGESYPTKIYNFYRHCFTATVPTTVIIRYVELNVAISDKVEYYCGGVQSYNSSYLQLEDCSIVATYGSLSTYRYHRLLSADYYGKLAYSVRKSDYPHYIKIIGTPPDTNYPYIEAVFSTIRGGSSIIQCEYGTTDDVIVTCSGNLGGGVFAHVVMNGYAVFTNAASIGNIIFSAGLTGKRYAVASGGTLDTGYRGTSFLPGSIPGTVDTSSLGLYV